MVKCPRCGIKGYGSYTSLVNLDRDSDGDTMIEINKVECDKCHYQFKVKEIFEIILDSCSNVE